MNRPWFVDMTLRPRGTPEIEVQPDGTVEVSWELRNAAEVSAMTLLLEPDQFSKMIDRGRELQVLGRVQSRTDAG